MNFVIAMCRLAEGQRVCRSGWRKKEYLVHEGDAVIHHQSGMGGPWEPDVDDGDLRATDWVLWQRPRVKREEALRELHAGATLHSVNREDYSMRIDEDDNLVTTGRPALDIGLAEFLKTVYEVR